MSDVGDLLAEQRLASQHFPGTITEEAQTDYNFWSAHDSENHDDMHYAVCPTCASKWRVWYAQRVAEKTTRKEVMKTSDFSIPIEDAS